MVQRQLRVGDLVDDYCPRERRISNHAVVAMVGDDVRQTRCTTCDAEHDYKHGKVPPNRKRKAAEGPLTLPPADVVPDAEEARAAADEEAGRPGPADEDGAPPDGLGEGELPVEGPVHRRLIRATLPKIEGQVPVRPIPEFTMHNAGGRPAGSHGKSFRSGPGGPHRSGPGPKSGPGLSRRGGPRPPHAGGAGPFSSRPGRGGHGAPHGEANPSRQARQAFGTRPPRSGKKH